LADFDENLSFSAPIRNIFNIDFKENQPAGSGLVPCGRAGGRTEITKLIVAFRSFAKVPKNRMQSPPNYAEIGTDSRGKLFRGRDARICTQLAMCCEPEMLLSSGCLSVDLPGFFRSLFGIRFKQLKFNC